MQEHAPNLSKYIINGLLTTETFIDQRKLFFLARIITSHKMPPLMNNLYRLRLLQSFKGLGNYITCFVKDTTDCLAKYMGLNLTLNSGHGSQFFLNILAGKQL